MSAAVRVRFAPSPTGHLHVGGARTALFNWLYARHHRGTFVLRIEDTDRSRSTEENIARITEALAWLGLDWDEGPPAPGYRQTERLPIYRAHGERLLAAGRAYYCDCARETLERERQAAQAKKETFRYSGRCRDRGLTAGALRLRIPAEGATVVDDLIHGPVTFEHAQLDDWILVRTDGTPTYNFCVVVDDVTMRITHVIRGDDHLPNTPKQILCYEALGYPVPALAHDSMILGADRSRLSKRHGATSVQAFRDAGIPAEAMVNYLALLGWNAGTEQEIFTLAELEEVFDIARVQRSSAMFDWQKLDWLNGHYIRQLSAEELAARLAPFLPELQPDVVRRAVPALQERLRRLADARELLEYLWTDPAAPDLEVADRDKVRAALAGLDGVAWEPEPIQAALDALREREGWSRNALFKPVRRAVTGRDISPPIHDTLALLPREEAFRRLSRVL